MGTKAEPIRVLIADDQPVALLGIREILEREPNISVVAEARSGTEVLHCLINLDVDILVLEVKLSGPQGVEVIRQLAQRVPLVPVLILSAYDEDELIQKMLDSGVSGYLLKQEAPKHIVEAIHGVARGETGWFSSKVVRKMLSLKDRESMLRRLEVTEREWEGGGRSGEEDNKQREREKGGGGESGESCGVRCS